MLVLTRKTEECIRIGDDIVIMVGRISKGKVSLRIDAPRHMPVNREEIWQRKLAESLELEYAS